MKNTPPHVKLSLPDGSRLTAVAYSQEDYPGINLYLSREGHPEELICFVEFNRERQAGENICIGVYQPDVDDTVYYEPYRVKGGQPDGTTVPHAKADLAGGCETCSETCRGDTSQGSALPNGFGG